MTKPCCICKEEIPNDVDQIKIDAEWLNMDDPNQKKQYWMHPDCADHTIDHWLALGDH